MPLWGDWQMIHLTPNDANLRSQDKLGSVSKEVLSACRCSVVAIKVINPLVLSACPVWNRLFRAHTKYSPRPP